MQRGKGGSTAFPKGVLPTWRERPAIRRKGLRGRDVRRAKKGRSRRRRAGAARHHDGRGEAVRLRG
eukprot:3584206-Alexandrium_andersonii.AAC.1